MKKSNLHSAILISLPILFQICGSHAYAAPLQYIVTGTLAEINGSSDSLHFEQARYQSILMIDTGDTPDSAREIYHEKYPATLATWTVPSITTISQRPGSLLDRQFEYQSTVRLTNFFTWEDIEPLTDQFSISTNNTDIPDIEFFELNTSQYVSYILRNDYWSNTLAPPPEYYAEIPSLPTEILSTDIVSILDPSNAIFNGRGSPSDAKSYYALNDVNIQLSTSVVPVPAAAWLFGSGLLGLIGVARRKTNA